MWDGGASGEAGLWVERGLLVGQKEEVESGERGGGVAYAGDEQEQMRKRGAGFVKRRREVVVDLAAKARCGCAQTCSSAGR